MQNLQEPSSELEKRQTNYLGALIVILAALVSAGMFFYFVLSLVGLTDEVLPEIDLETLIFGAAIAFGLYLLGLAVTVAISFILSLIFAMALGRAVIRFLDSRLLPGIDEEGEPTELLGKETYRTKPGERFEMLARPSWKVTHSENTLPTAVRASGKGAVFSVLTALAAAVIVGILAIFGSRIPVFLAVLPSYPVALVIILLGLVPRYWRVEWLRDNTLYILFTHTLIKLIAGESGIGLLLGRGSVADPTRQDTKLSEVGETHSAANPAKLGLNYKNYKLFNRIPIQDWFLDVMGGMENLRTYLILSHREEAMDVLMHMPNGPSFNMVMKHLIDQSKELSGDEAFIQQEARKLKFGVPDDPEWSGEAGSEEAEDYKRTRTETFGPTRIYNLYRLKFEKPRWDKNGNPINRGRSDGGSGLINLDSPDENPSGGNDLGESSPPARPEEASEPEIREATRLPKIP